MKKRLSEILEFVQSTDLQEVEWETKGALVSFRRSGVSSVSRGPQKTAAAAGSAPAAVSAAAPAAAPAGVTIKSTMVGTFFRSDSPNRPPLVVEGTVVTAGQPVAAIEAMKIMKDVVSPASYKIVKALVANGQPVEYGQPLFEVMPQAEETANV